MKKLEVRFTRNVESSMVVGTLAEDPGREELLRLAEKAGIKSVNAIGIIDEVQDAVNCWRDISEASGISKEMTALTAESFPKL